MGPYQDVKLQMSFYFETVAGKIIVKNKRDKTWRKKREQIVIWKKAPSPHRMLIKLSKRKTTNKFIKRVEVTFS